MKKENKKRKDFLKQFPYIDTKSYLVPTWLSTEEKIAWVSGYNNSILIQMDAKKDEIIKVDYSRISSANKLRRSLSPITINKFTWCYIDKGKVDIIHEVRDSEGKYFRTISIKLPLDIIKRWFTR